MFHVVFIFTVALAYFLGKKGERERCGAPGEYWQGVAADAAEHHSQSQWEEAPTHLQGDV